MRDIAAENVVTAPITGTRLCSFVEALQALRHRRCPSRSHGNYASAPASAFRLLVTHAPESAVDRHSLLPQNPAQTV
jgi:hypothetical protein